MKFLYKLTFLSLLLSTSCTNLYNINTVDNLDIKRYKGKWYEIARLPNSFEEGLDDIYTTYTPCPNEEISVMNIGYDKDKKLNVATALAYPLDNDYAKMRVCFFYPFYGDYAVTALADDYSYAVVESPPMLWILSRTTKLDDDTLNKILSELKDKNIDTSKLIYVKHLKSPEDKTAMPLKK